MMKPFLLLTVVLAVFVLGGCETMEGFGKDIQKLGDKIEKKADEASE